MTSHSELVFDDKNQVGPEQAEAISEIIEYAARCSNKRSNGVDEMTNILACVSISLLATIAMHLSMNEKGAKKLMKEVKQQVLMSLKEFEEGKLETVTLDDLTRRGRNQQ